MAHRSEEKERRRQERIAREEEARRATARKRMLELLGTTGVMGATPTRLLAMLEVEGIAPARESLEAWLAQEESAGRVSRASHGRWKAR